MKLPEPSRLSRKRTRNKQIFSRAVPVKTESWNRSIYLFLRIVLRKTATHFCWKCSRRIARASGCVSSANKKALNAAFFILL
ncbi:hypothetical protein BRY73_14605 [Ochrobactrum sp. P6BS-III]|nr:hypothetical protein BRY73_14605 [Ochrobactrum sp. P6BS-III]